MRHLIERLEALVEGNGSLSKTLDRITATVKLNGEQVVSHAMGDNGKRFIFIHKSQYGDVRPSASDKKKLMSQIETMLDREGLDHSRVTLDKGQITKELSYANSPF